MGVILDSSEIIALGTAGAHDLIIAATAIFPDYTVITASRRDFEKIEGVRLEVRQG